MDTALDEFKYLTSTCWNEKYQPLTIDMTKDRYQGRYRLRLNSQFIPDGSPFCIMICYLNRFTIFKLVFILT